MKKFFTVFIALTMSMCTNAQSNNYVPQMATSSFENKDAKYLLFPTKNVHIFLKLDTSTGELWMVLFSLGDEEAMEIKFPNWSSPFVTELQKKPGRFFLYPTQNMYNFLLIDQVDGRVWQAQWSFDAKNVGIMRIYEK